jgi:hypothetical protein
MNASGDRPPAISLRRIVKTASTVGAIVSGVDVLASVILVVAGVPELPRYLALLVAVTIPAYLGRLLVQGFGGYYRHATSDKNTQRLTRLFICNVALCLIWTAEAVVFWLWPSAFFQLLTAGSLWALVTWNACAIVDTLPKTNCKRGTEEIRSWGWFIRLRKLIRRSGLLKKVEEQLDNVTSSTDTSSFLNRISLVLIMVVLADIPSVSVELVAPIKHLGTEAPSTLSANAHHHRGHKVKKGSSSGMGSLPHDSQSGGFSTGEAETEPTYEQQCPGSDSRVKSAPVNVWRSFIALWKHEGATQAGCPQYARKVPGHPSIWYAIGTCGANVRSLGVYAPGQGATIQLQDAAIFGLELAKEGRLLSASSRATVADGDFYLFQTTNGTYSLSRSQSAKGYIKTNMTTLWCERYTSTNVPYVITPPNVTSIWWNLTADGFGWSWPSSHTGEGQVYLFRSYKPGEATIATTVCTSADQCTTWTRAGELLSHGTSSVALDELLAYAPGPVVVSETGSG